MGSVNDSRVDWPGRIVQINTSRGGVPKLPVDSAMVGAEGLVGDWQKNRKYHGGPMRAVCVYSREIMDALRAEGHPIVPGSTGENVLIEGVPWDKVGPGTGLEFSDGQGLTGVRLEVTSFTAPCSKIRASFARLDFARIDQARHPGFSRVYCRVLHGGLMQRGMGVRIVTL